MDDFSLVPVEHRPDFEDVSLVPVDHDPFGVDGVPRQVQAQQAPQVQAQAPLAQTQPQQLATTIWQPNIGGPSSDAPTATSSDPVQPNGPPAVPISAPDTPAPASQQQSGEVSSPGPASGGDGSSFGKRLLEGFVDAVPGAHYARLAQEQFRQGNYGAAAVYEAAAFGDAALGVATLGASTRLGTGVRAAETLAPVTEGVAGSGAASAARVGLAERAREIHNVLDQIAQRMRTTAVLETDAGRIVAGGSRDLNPAQLKTLGRGEIAAKAPHTHAEITAFDEAARIGAIPSELAVTRTICPQCAAVIESLGGKLTSRTTAVFPRR